MLVSNDLNEEGKSTFRHNTFGDEYFWGVCHSTVNDGLTRGIGERLDGWPNRDWNVGAIVAMAPNLRPFMDALQLPDSTIRKVLNLKSL